MVLVALTFAAVTELFLLRTFYRVGIYLPRQGPFRTIHAAATSVGSWAFDLATVLAALGLALLAYRASRRGRGAAAAAITAFLGVSLLAAFSGALGTAPVVRATFALAVVLLARPAVLGPGDPWRRLAIAAVAGVALVSSAAGFAADGGRFAPATGGGLGSEGLQLVGEVAVVAAAILLAVAWIREGPVRARAVLAGLLPALIFSSAWQGNGAVTGILVLWTSGLRMFLPAAVYVAALWAFASAAVGWRRAHPWRTVGMVLLFVGGFAMDTTYLHALVLLGLALISDGVGVGGLPEPVRSITDGDPVDERSAETRPTRVAPQPSAAARASG